MSAWPPAHPLAHSPRPLHEFTDIELVLLVSIVNSGWSLRPKDWDRADSRVLADAAALQVRFRDALDDEVRTREVIPMRVASQLIERALNAIDRPAPTQERG